MSLNYYVGNITADDDEDDPKFHIGKRVLQGSDAEMHFIWAQEPVEAFASVEAHGALDEAGSRYTIEQFQKMIDGCATIDYKSVGKKFC